MFLFPTVSGQFSFFLYCSLFDQLKDVPREMAPPSFPLPPLNPLRIEKLFHQYSTLTDFD